MSTLSAIRRPIEDDLQQYEALIRKSYVAESEPLHSIIEYVIDNRGKGIRPMLVLLSAGMAKGGEPCGASKRSLLAAMLVEMIHTASLVHDDVIDESDMRRGKPSVNARWQSRNAVLVGDYLLAETMNIGMRSGQFDIVRHIIASVSDLCEGELMQNTRSRSLDMSRKTYLEIIYKKTARLIGTSASVGALSVGADLQEVDTLRRFGDAIGMAFQIKDDILDYKPSSETGKPSGNDLAEHKITLPLLTVLEHSSEDRRTEIIDEIRRSSTPESISRIQQMVIEAGGLEEAEQVMRTYIDRALQILSGYPQSVYRDSLATLCGYISEREK